MRLLRVLFACCPALLAGSLEIRTTEIPWAAVGNRYDVPLQVAGSGRCPHGDVGFSLAAGALPEGIELAADGLHGTPRWIGQYHFWVRAANVCSEAVRAFTLFVTGKPILRTVPEELVFEYRQGGPDPELQTVQVSATWPRLPYSAHTTTPQWLEVRAAEGVTPERGAGLSADTVSVLVNPGKLAPGVYHSTLVVSAWGGSNTPTLPVTLKVLPAAK